MLVTALRTCEKGTFPRPTHPPTNQPHPLSPRTCHEGDRPHGLLHGDLRDRTEVEVGVVRHDDAAEEDRHDPGQLQTLGKEVRTKRKQHPHGKLQGVDTAKVHKLQKLVERIEDGCNIIILQTPSASQSVMIRRGGLISGVDLVDSL